MRERVGLSYLLCRLLDTVEDAQWSSFSEQERAFLDFDRFLEANPTPNEVSDWIHRFPIGLPEGERRLLDDAHRIFSDLHSWPHDLRMQITPLVLSMSAGMKRFMALKDEQGRLTLMDLAQVNQYCFFVAGLVGEILAQIASRKFSTQTLNLLDAFRFGLFLQKVNILKDQHADEKEGRFLVPSRSEVRSSMRTDAEGALRFLLGIPEVEKGFRLFCAWSLYLGLGTLTWIKNANADESSRRLPRVETTKILVSVEKSIHDNESLERLFEKLALLAFTEERNSSSTVLNTHPVEELLTLYKGQLPRNEVLGIFQATV